MPSEWFDRLDWNNENYEIVCTKDSSTYKAVKRSPKLKKHIKDLALQVAKNEKIATVNKVGADALLFHPAEEEILLDAGGGYADSFSVQGSRITD